ncbi:MAG: DUF2059 domain-containing protein [Sphingobium sp.]
MKRNVCRLVAPAALTLTLALTALAPVAQAGSGQAKPAPAAASPAVASPAAAEPLDRAQIDAARPVVEKLFPAGTYRRMMGENFTRMMDGMMDGVMKMPIADLARLGGIPADQVATMDQASLAEMSAIIDPHYRERTKGGMDAMMAGMVDLMDGFEPRVRDALTRAYARKFSIAELGQLHAFFATPTGGKYAGESMSIFMDPEIMGEMQALMPEMMQQMPALVEAAKKATDALPPPRKISDLSDAERKRLASILGVKEEELKDRPGAVYPYQETNEEGTEQ